jgi:hypothetical protein
MQVRKATSLRFPRSHRRRAQSSDVLRLDSVPEFITANGKPLGQPKNLDQLALALGDSSRVLRVRRVARDIDVRIRAVPNLFRRKARTTVFAVL